MPVLLTHAGTVLHATGSGLAHAAPHARPVNLAIKVLGQALHLDAAGSGSWVLAVQREAGLNAIRLRGEGGFLHADADGRTSFHDSPAGESGLFLLLNDDQYADLLYITAQRWAMQLPLAKSRPPAFAELLEGFRLRLCGCEVPLARAGIAFPRMTKVSAQSAGEVVFQYGDFLVGRARVYNPLIYLCVFGDESVLAMTALFLESLTSYGAYDGSIIILSNRAAQDLAQVTPAALRPRTSVLQLAYSSTAEIATARYRVAARVFEGFQPILYADVDTIAAAPLAPLLTDLLHQDGLCFASEFHDTRETNMVPEATQEWFGRTLFAADPDWSGRIHYLNSGLIGFAHAREAERVFPLVLAVIGQYQARGGIKLRSQEQAYLSYAVQKLKCGQPDFLNRYAKLPSRVAGDAGERHYSLMRFQNAAGYAKKLGAMRKYLQALSERGAAPAGPAGPP